jgi:DNA-binding NtrC family response regulator
MSFKDFDALLEAVSGHRPEKEKSTSSRLPLVLVVDDDPGIRASLNDILSEHYRLILSASASEGVAAFRDDVCAVVLDVKMSGHDGFWACDQIRKSQPDVPVIFYSAYQDAKDPFDIINAHRPFAYIHKDGTPQKLLSALETATRLYQSTLRSRRILERLKRRRKTAG